MCEFKVSLKAGSVERKVAEDIVAASLEGEEFVVRDVLGSAKRFKGVFISRVDVGKEVMTLTEMPVMSEILSFIQLYDLCKEKGEYQEEIESKWAAVKAVGDELIRSLWKKHRVGAKK